MESLDPARKDSMMVVLGQLVEPLAAAFPGPVEVVLHDLALLPHSIVAVAGDVTGRLPGGAATDMLLGLAARGALQTQIGYEGRSSEGTELKCSTIIVRVEAEPIAALCINLDVGAWAGARAAIEELAQYLQTSQTPPPSPSSPSEPAALPPESFPRSVDDLATTLVSRAIERVGVPVDLMKKHHKVAVVAELDDAGFFLIKESVEALAEALGVTRFTIYNYLNDLRAEEVAAPTAD